MCCPRAAAGAVRALPLRQFACSTLSGASRHEVLLRLLPARSQSLKEGDVVALRGYKRLFKLNGVVATIVRYLPARRRWRVWLESCPYPDGGSGFKNVKRCRLVRNTADDTSDGTPELVSGSSGDESEGDSDDEPHDHC